LIIGVKIDEICVLRFVLFEEVSIRLKQAIDILNIELLPGLTISWINSHNMHCKEKHGVPLRQFINVHAYLKFQLINRNLCHFLKENILSTTRRIAKQSRRNSSHKKVTDGVTILILP
jgi:hypothetical protein